MCQSNERRRHYLAFTTNVELGVIRSGVSGRMSDRFPNPAVVGSVKSRDPLDEKAE